MRPTIPLFLLASMACCSASTAQRSYQMEHRTVAPPQDVAQEAVQDSIARGIVFLRSMQRDDRWLYNRTKFAAWPGGVQSGADFHGGLTALALYAMASSGVGAKDPAITRGIAWCKAHPAPFGTGKRSNYSAALLVMALSRIDAKQHKTWIHQLAGRIAGSQLDNGMWTYALKSKDKKKPKNTKSGFGPGWSWMHTGDGSNTQFAVMALWAAQTRAQYRVPSRVWKKVRDYHTTTQRKSGGWSYKPPRKNSAAKRPTRPGFPGAAAPAWMHDPSPAMTAAGVFAFTCAKAGSERGLPNARKDKITKKGLTAFRADKARWGELLDNYYFAYSVERVGSLHGLPDTEWYTPVANKLVRRQDNDGSWRRGFGKGAMNYGDDDRVYETSLALLCLSRATSRPITKKR